MKKYLKMIPIMVYPYVYLVFIIVLLMMQMGEGSSDAATDAFVVIAVLFAIGFNLTCWIIAILNSIQAGRGKYTVLQSARINCIVKCVQIPAYIFHFIVGLIGLVMSVWGIGFILWAILIDLLTIFQTGLASIGLACRMKKEGVFKNALCVLFGIGSWIYCVDVAIAIAAYVYLAVDSRRKKIVEAPAE